MSGVDVSEFKKITGLKNAKIAQIKAAIELGRRMSGERYSLARIPLDDKYQKLNLNLLHTWKISKIRPSA